MLDIASAEEEIMRWKVAAQQEADAGKAVEQEYMSQVKILDPEDASNEHSLESLFS